MASNLTKSKFKLALECPSKLYYVDKPEYANQQVEDSFLQALAEGGYQVEALARCYFPDGVVIQADNNQSAISKYLICVKGFKNTNNNSIDYKAFIVLWKDTPNKYYKNNNREKAYYIVGWDNREFPWQINNLTDSVLTNLDTVLKKQIYNIQWSNQ